MGSVPDRARVLPEDLLVAVTATNTTAMEMTVPKPLFPWRLGPTEIFPRGRYRSVPIPKRQSSWSICFCWCARDWNFSKWTGAVENWASMRYQLLSFTELCGKSVSHRVGRVFAMQVCLLIIKLPSGVLPSLISRVLKRRTTFEETTLCNFVPVLVGTE